jgi:hypothetical protein
LDYIFCQPRFSLMVIAIDEHWLSYATNTLHFLNFMAYFELL